LWASCGFGFFAKSGTSIRNTGYRGGGNVKEHGAEEKRRRFEQRLEPPKRWRLGIGESIIPERNGKHKED
jgi:hypothetical protein